MPRGLFCRKKESKGLPEKKQTIKYYFCKTIELYFCVCIHRYMGTKTISIRDNTYDMLKNAKREWESFSDTIDRLLKKEKKDLSVYFGALENDDLLEGLAEDSRKMRELSRLRI